MMHPKAKTLLTLFIATDVLLAADLLSKKWAVSSYFKAHHFIGDFFHLIPFQKNDGIAFSINVPSYLQIIGSITILLLLSGLGIKYLFQQQGKSTFWPAIFLGMVIGGGIGNLIDRLVQGYVVDFIALGPIPIFNIADVGITVGLVLLFVTMVLQPEEDPHSKGNPKDELDV